MKKYMTITLVIVILSALVCSFAASGEDMVCVPEISGSYVVGVAPETTFAQLVEVMPDIIVDLTKKNGTVLGETSKEVIATGDDIRVNGAHYTVVVLCDLNCDGKVDASDAELVKTNIQTGAVPKNIAKKVFMTAALCKSSDSQTDIAAYLKLKRQIGGTYDAYADYKMPASSVGNDTGWSEKWN